MKTLYLHIGHPKTGTSFIQSSLSNSVQALAREGVEYYRGTEGAAQDWKISSGNGNFLINMDIKGFSFTQNNVLFSSEQLFLHICKKPEFCTKLERFCTFHGFTSVRILLFTRDPLSHAESSYQQSVKRGGGTNTVNRRFAKYFTPRLVQDLLTNPPELPNLKIDVFNYDRNKRDLIAIFTRFLGIPEGTILEVQERAPVNRSMTEAELVLQRAVNVHLGGSGGFLSDALCEQLPDVAAERVYPSRPVQRNMIERLSGSINAVNAMVPETEHYHVDLQKPIGNSDMLQFSREQVEVVGQAFGEHAAALQVDLILTRYQLFCATAELRIKDKKWSEAKGLLGRAQNQLDTLIAHKHDESSVSSMQRHITTLKNRAG